MTRPGGWVEGIGWVALLCDLAEGDQYDWCEHAAVRDAGTVPLRTPIVVTRWADGTTPTPSSVTDEEAAERRVSEQVAADAVWMAKLARGSSWPGEMAQRVDDAAARVLDALEGR